MESRADRISMNEKYFFRDHLKAFKNALSKGYKLDGVMYMESLRETQEDGKTYFFDIFKYQVSRERFLVQYQQ
jgi:hypothetical protein